MALKRIATSLIQFDCPSNKSEAITQIVDLVRQAGPESDLILLGETPYTPYTTASDFAAVAERIPGDYSDCLSRLAKEFNTYICSGVIEEEGGNIYNSAILISPDGEIVHKHRKVKLAGSDSSGGFSPGSEVAVVETALGRIGILICLDSSDRMSISEMAALNPDLILVPAYGLAKSDYTLTLTIDCMVDDCIDEWRMRMQMLAKYCKSYVLRADHCGMENQQVRVGHSLAVTPGGYVISEATMKPTILQVHLDPSSASQRAK